MKKKSKHGYDTRPFMMLQFFEVNSKLWPRKPWREMIRQTTTGYNHSLSIAVFWVRVQSIHSKIWGGGKATFLPFESEVRGSSSLEPRGRSLGMAGRGDECGKMKNEGWRQEKKNNKLMKWTTGNRREMKKKNWVEKTSRPERMFYVVQHLMKCSPEFIMSQKSPHHTWQLIRNLVNVSLETAKVSKQEMNKRNTCLHNHSQCDRG